MLASISLAVLAMLVAACASSHSTNPNTSRTNGNKAALCKFDADFSKAGKLANNQQQYLRLLKSFEPRFDPAIANAPPDIKPDVQTLISGLRQMIRANSTSVSPKVADKIDQAGNHLDAYCGLP